MAENLKDVLMRRDGLTEKEAEESIAQARGHMMDLLENGNMLEALDICEDEFGLEPDYLMDLI